MQMEELKNSYQQTKYKLGNHGNRDVGVLKQVLEATDSDVMSDIYGTGDVIETFEEKMADVLGKQAAGFFPSGTMAQQIALRIWTDEKKNKKIAYHPLSHLEIHEEDGLKELHQIVPILLGEKTRLITFSDIENLEEPIACLLLELPQREIGGQLPSFEELVAISTYCREKGIIFHLDGARLWECLPYYEKTAAEICQLFDSVYVSFYKGLGGVAGAILAGNQEFIKASKIWKRRYGGDLISLYPYILPANYYYEQRIDKMSMYYASAKKLAAEWNDCPNIETVPKIPVANMFHVHFSKPIEFVAPLIAKLQEMKNLGLTGVLKKKNEMACFFELSLGDAYQEIPQSLLEEVFEELKRKLAE